MPELPEVETTRRGLIPHLTGKRVTQVIIRETRLRWPVPETLVEALPGRTLHAILRRGKYLLFTFEGGTLIIHLGMSGSIRLVENAEVTKKHDHVDLAFANTLTLRYHDPRRFGCVLWTEDPPETHPLLLKMGMEPLEETFNGQWLFQQTRDSACAIKTFIMNANRVTGIGNIYANEALFMAGIHPFRKACSLSVMECVCLVTQLKTVLAESIARGGTTLKDFVNGHGQPGYFQQSLRVYQRQHAPCLACSTPIQLERQCQRSSFFCPTCQPPQ